MLENLDNMALLANCLKGSNALEKAARVLDYTKGDLLAYTESLELARECGLTLKEANLLINAVELGRRASVYSKDKFDANNPSCIFNYLSDMQWLTKEHFRVVFINSKLKIFGSETVSIGDIDSCSASPREVFAPAIKKGAASIAVAHNHPSGDSTPSRQDDEVTKTLIGAGRILGVPVIDHLVIGEHIFYSYRNRHGDWF